MVKINLLAPKMHLVREKLSVGQVVPSDRLRINRYLNDMPPAVIGLVQRFESFDLLERWLDQALALRHFGVQLTDEAYSHLITIALLFGFESKPDKGLIDSKGSILRNWRVSEEDKGKIWSTFYDPQNYLYQEDLGDVVNRIHAMLTPVEGWRDCFMLFDRIKQYGSLIEKMRKAVARLGGSDNASLLSVEELIERTMRMEEAFAGHASELLDDILGFNFIINDAGMDEQARERALTEYSGRVTAILEAQTDPKLMLVKIIKASRTPGFEAVNLFIHDWLIHQRFGNLPIKIQFRFKTALFGESAMYYGYKRYGRWEFPPWSGNIDFGRIRSFRELQIILFENFKRWSAGRILARVFSIHKHLIVPATSFLGRLNVEVLPS